MIEAASLCVFLPGVAAFGDLSSGFSGLAPLRVGGARPRREAERIIWAVGELPLRMNGCKRYSMLGCSIRDQTLIDVVPITSFFDPSFLFLSITFTRISSV